MKSEFRHVFLPYCLDRQPDGRWIVLNRNYKPLGVLSRDWVKYEDHPGLVKLRLMPQTLQALSAPGSTLNETRVYLYNDGCIPTTRAAHWRAYQERLERLSKLSLGD